MKQREPVSHIMSKELITVNSTHTLMDVRHIFEERRLHHLPVVSGDKLLGMLSYTDLMRATYGVGEAQEQVNAAIYHTVPIESVMTANPVIASKWDLLEEGETIIDSHYMKQLLIYGIKLGGTGRVSEDPVHLEMEALVRTCP